MSLPIVLRALALLGALGASCTLFVQELRGDWLLEFVRKNALSLPNRHKLVVTMGSGAVVAVALGVLVVWRSGAERLRRLSHLLAPLMLLGFVPPLCLKAAWAVPLNAVIAIASVVLLAERLLRLSLETSVAPLAARQPSAWLGALTTAVAKARGVVPGWLVRWAPVVCVALAAVGYAVYMSVFTLRMHGRFQTYGYDLGQYDNIFWSTLHGRPLRDAPLGLIEDWSELRGHASLSVFVLLPFYALRPQASTLLVLQACILGLGAIPLYRFAARRLPRGQAAMVAIAFLLYPPLHGLQFYDFHMQPIACTFVLFVIDFVDARRYWLLAIAFVIAIGCREDVSIGLAILGAFLALSGHRAREGLIMAPVAAAYFVVMRFVVMPRFGPTYFLGTYKDLTPEGAVTFGGVILTLITNPTFVLTTWLNPEKLRYALQILTPLALMPLRRPWMAVALIHGSILTLLTTGDPPMIEITFQYSANFMPYIFAASAHYLGSLPTDAKGSARRWSGMFAVALGTVLCGVHWGAIPPRETIRGGFVEMSMLPPLRGDLKKHDDLQALHAMVPQDAWLAVSEQEMPHLSRLNMLSLRDTTNADYLLYGVGSGGFGGDNGERALAAGEFEVLAERPGLKLLKRRAVQANPATVQAKSPEPVPVPAVVPQGAAPTTLPAAAPPAASPPSQ